MIALVTDSTCDLPADVVQSRQIQVVPQYIIWGTESLRDGAEMTGEQFYQRLGSAAALPRTAQPTPADFVQAFQQAREATQADEVLVVTLSSKTSGTYSSAVQAAKDVDFKVRVVDSRLVSMALGFLVLRAADLVDKGNKLDDIVNKLETYIPNIDVFFTVATLDFLHRGGRIGKAKHLVGKALQIKPILHLTEGQVASLESVRTRNRALNRLSELVKDRLATTEIKRLAVMHGQARQEADVVAKELEQALTPQVLYRSSVCAAVGTHTGPGIIGVAYDSNGE